MSKKAYPLRVNAQVLEAVQRWADDDLRSVNAQIEFILRAALVDAGRVKITQTVTTVIEPIGDEKKGAI